MIKKTFAILVGLVMLVACGSNETETVATAPAPSVNTSSTMNTSTTMNTDAGSYSTPSVSNTSGSSMTSGYSSNGSNNPILGNARPGECYAQIVRPPKYKTASEKVLATAESFKIKTIPATYRTATKTIVTKEAGTKLKVIPATYKTVTETIVVKPAGEKLVAVPATYKTVTKKIEISPATQVWKKGTNGDSGARAAGQGGYGSSSKTGNVQNDILCLVTVPAKYKTVSEKIVVSPATTKSIPIPAVTKTVKRRVIDQPARTTSIPVPAITKTITMKELATPAREVKTPIPATYKTITKKVMVDAGQTTWGRILCKTNSDVSVIKSVQSKVGVSADGNLGPNTYRAVRRYQERNGLAVGGITYETLGHMGINM